MAWRDGVARLFAIDLRTLAVLRVAVAGTLLFDVLWRSTDLVAFYSDEGVLTRELLHRPWQGPFPISIHMLSGAPWFEALLFGVHALAALGLLVGYRTRLCGLLAWLFTISMYTRNPFTVYGASQLLGLLLFWGLFLPWGARFSLDRAWRHAPSPSGRSTLSLATAAVLLQMPLVYFFTAVLKDGPAWRQDFTAIYYALASDIYTIGLGPRLLSLPPSALQVTTATMLALEFLAPVLLFIPFHTKRVRLAAVAVLSVMQLGFLFCLRVGIFPVVSTVALLPFLPGSLWDRLGWRADASAPERAPRASGWRFRLEAGLLAAALLFVLYDNLQRSGWVRRWPALERPSHTLWIRQNWVMFAPEPPRFQPWFVAVGALEGGERIHLLNGGIAALDEKPPHIVRTFPNIHWMKYQQNLSPSGRQPARDLFVDYLCREWNRSHPEEARLLELTLYRVRQPLGRSGPLGEPRVVEFASRRCRGPAV